MTDNYIATLLSCVISYFDIHLLTERLDTSRLIDKCKSASECRRLQIWLIRVRGGLLSKINMDGSCSDASATDGLVVV